MSSLYTKAEALAVIKRAPVKSRFFIRLQADAPLIDKPGYVLPQVLSSYLQISRKEAARLCDKMLCETVENRGGRLPIECEKSKYSENVNYWLL